MMLIYHTKAIMMMMIINDYNHAIWAGIDRIKCLHTGVQFLHDLLSVPATLSWGFHFGAIQEK